MPEAAAGLPQGSGSAGHSFELSAIQDREALPDFQFSQPVNITIHYAESDVGLLDENSLALYMWDGTAWVPAEQTCQPAGAVLLDTESNTLATEICHLSHFAMLADSYQVLFLPLISR